MRGLKLNYVSIGVRGQRDSFNWSIWIALIVFMVCHDATWHEFLWHLLKDGWLRLNGVHGGIRSVRVCEIRSGADFAIIYHDHKAILDGTLLSPRYPTHNCVLIGTWKKMTTLLLSIVQKMLQINPSCLLTLCVKLIERQSPYKCENYCLFRKLRYCMTYNNVTYPEAIHIAGLRMIVKD